MTQKASVSVAQKNTRYATWITQRWHDHLIQVRDTTVDEKTKEELSNRLAGAVVVSPDDILEGRVQFGSQVTVFAIEEEEEQSFQIVSRDESFSGPGLLDQSSPLAQALFGAVEGQVVSVVLENRSNCQYEVTHIRLPK